MILVFALQISYISLISSILFLIFFLTQRKRGETAEDTEKLS